ncbi:MULTISPECIES: hybrid non-ribosomal peptide synthetase/type I polyketide synthase [Clostridium]|uniref:hybrid non-ribosomal peptide synthetase/type I polyketide synthase n=1 Tax=Clostridium TaxID=1485 RepID=UPI000826ECF1|nr:MULTISPECIES: hybrid non-ribosomal peptide synthetase/type I polyketide synthase [Clostridium]PJI09448.1 non-ribosomal peptide synthetase [Clostridium sp. CT7]
MEQDVNKYKAALKKAANKIEELSNKINEQKSKDDIAIIGYSCRFPGGASDPEKFWDILSKGIDTVTEIKDSRFDYHKYYSENADEVGKMNTKYASFLKEDIQKFDNAHFGISALEASSIDPQHRLLLEVSWEAMENSALNIEKLKGSRTGVFVGVNSYEYSKAEIFSGNVSDITPYSTTGASLNSASGRLSYFYDFKGPAITCDTACSSSIVALNLAVDSLRNNQCDMAIVGGSNLLLSPESFIGLSKFNGLSKDGKCKAFDDSADGFGRGEGCGVVILKRFKDAKADGNDIVALVKSVFVGQDGRSNGFTAPNGISQQNVIKQALNDANLTVDDLDYVEAHGTGTALGDSIEAHSISEVFKSRKKRILIGSVKSNIGHLEAASGMASLIKVLLCIERKKIPPSINFETPNHNINWDKIKVVDRLIDWDNSKGIRRAGINSFGFSGTLAHAIIEESPTEVTNENLDTLPYYIMTFSAKSEKALKDYIGTMKEYVLKEKKSIGDIAYTTNISRSYLRYRVAIIGKNKEEFAQKIEQMLNKTNNNDYIFKKDKVNGNKIAFLFTGQGSIYKDIAKNFYRTSKPFREILDLCNKKFKDILNISVIDAIYGDDDKLINSPIYSQPIIFSIEYALTRLWNVIGIKPKVVIGHSIGEYAAACYAGLISLDDAVAMIAQRGRMMDSINIDGKMVGVLTNIDKVKAAIEESGVKNVSIAAINAPENVTISGLSNEVDKVVANLQQKERVFINKLNISHPYHSSMMKKYANDYDKNIGDIKFSKLKVNMISSITGKLENEEVLGKKKYWVEHLSNTVKYESAIEEARKLGINIFIEIGGDATLAGLANQCIEDEKIKFLPSLRKGINNYKQWFNSVSTLFLSGMELDWNSFYKTYKTSKVKLPNYRFQRKRFWRDIMNKDIKVQEYEKNTIKPKEIEEIQQKSVNKKSLKNKEKIELELQEMIKSITLMEIDEIEKDINLFTLGFDSLVLVTFNKKIANKYKINISLNEFFTKLDTIEKIAEYIYENTDEPDMEDENVDTVKDLTSLQENSTSVNTIDSANQVKVNKRDREYSLEGIGSVQQIFNNQIQVMSEQLQIIKKITNGDSRQAVSAHKSLVPVKNKEINKNHLNENKISKNTRDYYVPYKKLNLTEKERLNDLKLKYVKSIEKKYTSFTKNSKENTQKYRKVYANNRNVAGFRPLLKEMIYQIIVQKGKGSKIWDIDGNELIDLTMGFGVNLFGHNPSFVEKALKEEIGNGMPLGPMGRLAGTVAKQISELTGVERVAFYNTGTEANMVAVRIARAITGRKKIVAFAGSYHGTFDGLLGLSVKSKDGSNVSIPLAPGVMESMVKDLIILDYNSEESLEFIKNNPEDIAGVLVETVQSRRPDVQPKEFLKKLRHITEEEDIALIFDEVITGFRISAGGAQEYFGVKADIVTYGKVAGGGMPIGIVAGKSKYLDSIDGGMWSYGDDSVPTCNEKRTFVAGTFCHHPLAMAAAHATLKYIKENKDTMYKKLNEKTNNFVVRINKYFEEEDVPIRVVNFGSLFRFVLKGDFEIFFYGLLEKGIYIWEGRNCFFSTEHSNEDIEKFISAIKLTIDEMREAGYFDGMSMRSVKKKETTLNKQVQQSVVPMSMVQQRLYTQSLIKDQDPYNIISVFKVKGKLDIDRLESVLNKIVRRHESLRTRLYVEEGKFKQEILKSINFKVTKVKKENGKNLNDLIEESITKFNLSEAPLFKATLINIEDNDNILIFDFHHTIADGMSMNVFVQEFIKLYANESLPIVNKQYRDFVDWEKQYVDSDDIKISEKYWLNKLSGDINIVNLPADYPIKSEVSFAANTVKMKIYNNVVSGLKVIARRNKCSLYMILVSTFNVLLKKLSGNDDILVGTPVTNRADGLFDESIGMFTNTIVLRNNPSDEKKFESFLSEVKQNCLEAYSHMYYPFNFLNSNANKSKNGENSLINVMFVYENVNQRIFKINDLEVSPYEYKAKVSEFDFIIEILEENGIFNINLTYKTDLFKEDTVKRWGEYYKNIFDFILNKNNEDFKIKDIDIIGEDEKNKLLYEFNDTKAEYPKDKTINELFEQQVEKTPDNTAVVFEDKELTYRELNEKSNSLARVLREKGVGSDVIVGIMVERSLEMIVGILGILKAGGAYMPIDPEYPEDRIKYMVKDSKIGIILTQRKLVSKILYDGENIDLEDSSLYGREKSNLSKVSGADNLAYIIYTSGTTGKPKGVMIKHSGISNLKVMFKNDIKVQENDRVLQFASFAFDASVLEITMSLLNGAQLNIVSKEVINNYLKFEDYLNNNKITIAILPPTYLNSMDNNEIKTLRILITGGSAIKKELLNKWSNKVKYINAYGPTETTICSTIWHYSDNAKELDTVPIGRPINNLNAYVVNKNLKLVPIGVAGELCISGDGLARGYLNNEKLTAEKFVENPYEPGQKMYKTGDLARWLPDGNIEFIGRIDNQVKIRGFRIELGEIENSLLKLEGIKEAVVISREQQENKCLCAYYVSEKEYSIKEIRRELKKNIPDYMIPSYFICLKQLPITKNGKVDRKKLPIPDEHIDTGVVYEAPRNEIEKILVKVWKDILNSKKIGITDDFFSLGGDSIKAIQLASRTKAKGYSFEIEKLYENSTIKDLSKYVKKNEMEINQQVVKGKVKLTPIQKWFFEEKFQEENHWNQAIMLYKKNGFNIDILNEAFNKIIIHHDALRMIFKKENGEVIQINRGIEEKLYDLTIYENLEEKEITEKCNEIQSSINLEKGPLVKLGLFKTKLGDHLLIAIHHLVIDAVSWRILFEDLGRVYTQIEKGEKVTFAEKTTSFKEWSEKQNEYSNSYNIRKQIEYWNSIEAKKVKKLPKDKITRSKEVMSQSFELGNQYTEDLLKKVNKIYNTEINDVLLAALALTISNWTGNEETLINLEAHGREDIIKDVDISRTVGWFTSQYPVILKAYKDISDTLKNTKDMLRRIPNKGMSYGIIKYLSKQNIDCKLKPEICFNYLGQADSDIRDNIFKLSSIDCGDCASKSNKSLYSLDFEGIVLEDKLNISITYLKDEFDYSTIEKLIKDYKVNLINIINHCMKKKVSEITVSEITKEEIKFDELEKYKDELDNIKDIYQLSPMQEGMLYNALSAEKDAYDIVMSLEIEGYIDKEILDKAFNKVIERHDILRTKFDYSSFKGNMQVVYKNRKTKVEYIDISNKCCDKEKYVEVLIDKYRKNGFDLSNDILIKLILIKMEDNKYNLILNNHHILMDGWCIGLVISELFKIYNEIKYGYKANLNNVIPYSKYIEWLKNKDVKATKNYWINYLKGYNEVAKVPFEKENRNNKVNNKEISLILDEEKTELINDIAEGNKVTVNTVIQSIWAILLQKYNNIDDIVYGYVVSGRSPEIKGIEDMVGLFINTIPLRIKFTKDMVYEDLLRSISNTTLENSKYDYLGLAEIQNLCEVKNKLINNILIFENYPIDYNELSKEILTKNNLKVLNCNTVEETNYNFNIVVSKDKKITIEFKYNEETYSTQDVSKIKAHFENVIKQIIENENIKIQNIEIVSTEEKNKLVYEFNNTRSNYEKEKTITELFEEQVEKTPNNIAAIYENESITYEKLNEKANSLARELVKNKVKPNDVVGLIANKSIKMIVGIIAILKTGAAYMPIDYKYTSDRMNFMLTDAKVNVVLGEDNLLEKVDVNRNTININDKKIYRNKKTNLNIDFNSDNLAYIIYTSGSTGTPKGILIRQYSVIRVVKDTNYIQINSKDSILQLSSYVFDGSVFDIYGALLNGARLVIPNKDDILDLKKLGNLIKKEVSIFFVTTALFNSLVDVNVDCLKSVRKVLFGGERVSLSHAQKALKVLGKDKIIHVYGPTESTVYATYYPLNEINKDDTTVPIGKAISNTKLYVLGKDNDIKPIGVPGELCIGGDGLAAGYLNNERLTKEKFIDNPYCAGEKIYRTGDLVKCLPSGDIEFIDRIDQQVKIRGFRIELGEVEKAIAKISGIKENTVIAVENGNGKALCAYYVSERKYTISELREELKTILPQYMIPAYFVSMGKMPLTKNGKIDKKALPEIGDDIETGNKYIAPRNEVEKVVALVWQSVLEVKRIGINDNFFELGGDSIKAIQVIAKMNAKGYSFGFKDLFNNPTIRELIGHIKQRSVTIDQSEVKGEIELTPIQKWFLVQDNSLKNHFNQELMLFSKDGFKKEFIEQAFNRIIKHHDVLRAVYVNGKFINRKIDDKLYDISIYDLRGKNVENNYITNLCTNIQASMNLEKGPLVKLGLFKTDEGDHLLVAIHHMVVDDVSWRIILEDFNSIYNGLKNGENVKLQPKTTSFKEWAAKQKEYASSYKLKNEISYWNKLSQLKVKKLFKDYEPKNLSLNTVRHKTMTLNMEDTKKLLTKVNIAYSTEINDILLSALALTIGNFNKSDEILFNLESHGREEIIEGVDIKRTVGWFTSQCPVVLKKSNDLSELIKNTKDTLRRMPNKGIGYGILKYLSDYEIKDLNKPEISFNYLGQIDENISGENFRLSKVQSGESISRDSERLYPLDIVGIVVDKKLEITLSYSSEEYKDESIESLLKSYKENIKLIIDHCMSKNNVEITVSDITKENISLEELKNYSMELENIKSIYALTPMQEGLLYESIVRGGETYHISMEIRVIGKLNIDILNESFKELVTRHDIFRTNFDSISFKENMQIVYKTRKANLEYRDIRNIDVDKEEYITNLIKEDRKRGFDLSKDLLIRLFVVRIAEKEYSLILSNHHIILDGWSFGIISGELFNIYNSIMSNIHEEVKKEVPYEDYVRWIKSQDKGKALNYWSDYLSGYDNNIEIPFKKEKVSEGKPQKCVLKIDKNQTKLIELLAKDNNVTMNTILQSIWAIQLQKYNNVDDVTFGFIVSGRATEINGIDKMVGLFINTIPLRVNTTLEKKYSEVIKKINLDFIENEKYRYCSIAEIQNITQLKSGLTNTLMVFENTPIDKNIINKNILEKANIKITNPKCYEEINDNLNLKVTPGEEIVVEFIYNDGVYSEEAVNKIKSHFENILNEVIKNPNVSIDEIEMLGEDERRELLVDFNDTYMDYKKDTTIQELFEYQACKNPQKAAVLFEDKKMSYSELNMRANSLASLLREKGIGLKHIVPILMDRSFEMVIGILAVLKAGAAYLPIDPDYPEDRINYILKDSKAQIILTTKGIRKQKSLEIKKFIEIDNKELYTNEIEKIDNINNENDLAYVIYTSGTTGKPKGVMVEHRGVINLKYWFENELGIGQNENILQFASIAFDAFSWELYMSLLLGNTLCIPCKDIIMNPDLLNKYIRDNNITTISLPPFMAANLEEDNGLKRVITEGSELRFEQISHLLKKVDILNAYGPTEDTVCTTYYKLTKKIHSRIPIGKPIKNHRVLILDNSNKLVPVGLKGELCISGVGLARGYLNNEELTKKKFIENPYVKDERLYKTGDVARWLPDGNIEYLGRIDNQVKIRGFRIEMSEIEEGILKIPGISETAVIDKEKDGMKYICAYYASKDDMTINLLRKALMKSLPKYMIPSYFIRIDKLPLNTNGKVDRKLLPEVGRQIKTGVQYEGPQNELEGRIVDICEEVLGLERLSVKDNLFEVGADSIRIANICGKLKKVNVNISINDMFYYENIRDIYNNCIGEKISSDDKIDDNNEITNLNINEIKQNLNNQISEFNSAILEQNKVRTYPMSAMQQITREANKTCSGCVINLDYNINVELLKKSIIKVINTQSLLRSTIIKVGYKIEIQEYDVVKDINIPYLNLEKVSEDERENVKEYIINKFYKENFENKDEVFNKILYKVIIVRLSDTNYKVYIPFNHLFFDGMSMEIIKANILKAYSNNAKLEEGRLLRYDEYVKQLSEGPQQITDEELMEKFDLNNFRESLKKYLLKFKASKLINTTISIRLTKDIQDYINETQWDSSLKIFLKILELNFEIEDIPFTMIYPGRRYKGNNYYNTIGEFIDIIPLHAERGKCLSADHVKSLINAIYEKNINFTTLLRNKKLKSKYKNVSKALEDVYTGQINIPIFNYIGLYDFKSGIKEFYEKSWLYKTKELSTEISIMQKENKLIIRLFCENNRITDITKGLQRYIYNLNKD